MPTQLMGYFLVIKQTNFIVCTFVFISQNILVRLFYVALGAIPPVVPLVSDLGSVIVCAGNTVGSFHHKAGCFLAAVFQFSLAVRKV